MNEPKSAQKEQGFYVRKKEILFICKAADLNKTLFNFALKLAFKSE